jgi:hypothetical protein
MFDRGEAPAIIFGIVVAVILLFAANLPPSGIYSEHRNYSDTLARSDGNK